MAQLKLKDGRILEVTQAQAQAVYDVSMGLLDGTTEQRAFAAQVHDIEWDDDTQLAIGVSPTLRPNDDTIAQILSSARLSGPDKCRLVAERLRTRIEQKQQGASA